MKEYIPKCLREEQRQKREVMYAIGVAINDKPNDIGMIYGPVKDIQELLDEVGVENSYIVVLNADSTHDPLWRWHKDRWISMV